MEDERPTETEEYLDVLEESNVFVHDGGEYRPSDSFERKREEYDAIVDEEPADIAEATGLDDADVDGLDPGVLRNALALRDMDTGLGWDETVSIASAISRFDTGSMPDGPEYFVPLKEEEVEPFLQSNRLALVFFWKDGSDSCEAIASELESLAEAGELDDVGLGSVYTPMCGGLIREEYQVGVVPTMLFCVNGRVDSRLIGPQPRAAIQDEIDTIHDVLQAE